MPIRISIAFGLIFGGRVTTADDAAPRVHDARLELTLLAEDPQIVTPIGLAIDQTDRLFVLESHTHERPSGYDGPTFDRVKIFTDADHDGDFDDFRVFADGIQTGLNLAFSPDGVLHVVCAREVLALPDQNGDGVCDGATQTLKMQTGERYSHNCLLGITFDRDGWMYVSRGNTGSTAYKFIGTDGSVVAGYGDGGSIIRCRSDGSQLEEFATGFWNPFEIKFDHAGRLLCVDNDPDARGPNRLVHVVRGGDYGYRSLYGGGGNHPFQGWDGDLPGTLPYISGTGEAPCDLIDCRLTALPIDYANDILVTVWNENTIERHTLNPRGVSLQAERRELVSGGNDFRPVAIEADSRGNVYITDWVLVDYPNHGRGRLWKLSARDVKVMLKPRGYFDEPEADTGQESLAEVFTATTPDSWPVVHAALTSGDAFLHHAAVLALSQPVFQSNLWAVSADHNPDVRLGCLLAHQRVANDAATTPESTRRFLSDPDARVRRAALVWVGTSMATSLRSDIDKAIDRPDVSAMLFETYLAVVENLDPKFIEAFRKQTEDKAKRLKRTLPEGLIEQIAFDKSGSPLVRGLAISRLPDPRDPVVRNRLLNLAVNADVKLQLAALRQLAGDSSDDVRQTLTAVASNPQQSTEVRCEALLSLSQDTELAPAAVVSLLDDDDASVALEAARGLRQFAGNEAVKAAARAKRDAFRSDRMTDKQQEQLAQFLGEEQGNRPTSLEQWQEELASGGDAAAGRRVFYSAHATCSKCHTTGGVGGILGPDLSSVADSVDRAQVIHSIIRPSDKFPPQYQAWVVITTDGKVHTGLQLDHKAGGAIEMLATDGVTRRFDADAIEAYQASQQSVMPDGLDSNLTVSELRDLVAYLMSLSMKSVLQRETSDSARARK